MKKAMVSKKLLEDTFGLFIDGNGEIREMQIERNGNSNLFKITVGNNSMNVYAATQEYGTLVNQGFVLQNLNSINLIIAYPSESVKAGDVEAVALLDPAEVNNHAYVNFKDKLIPINQAAMLIYEKLAA